MRPLVTCAWLVVTAAIAAAGDDPTARSRLDEYKRRDQTDRRWSDRRQTATFEVHDATGVRRQTLRFFEQRASDGSRKLLVRILDSSLQGLGILIEIPKEGDSRQRLYLHKSKNTRELSESRRRQEPIASSNLTHDDLELTTVMPGWGPDDAEAHGRGSEPVDGETCDVIELVPKRASVQYKRITMWLGQKDLLVHRLEFSLDGKVPTKTIMQKDFTDVGRVPVARNITVETPGEKSMRTDITVTESDFDIGIGDDCFKVSTLEDPGKDADACRGTSK